MKSAYLLAALTLAVSAMVSSASAQGWTFGLGTDGAYSSDTQEAISLEGIWTAAPRGELLGVDYGFGAGFETDTDGDIWAGAGLYAQRDFNAVRLSVSVMPGLYEAGSRDTELGGTVEIRSRLGISVAAGPGRIGPHVATVWAR